MTDFDHLPRAFTEEWRHALILMRNEITFLRSYINGLETRVYDLESTDRSAQLTIKTADRLPAERVIDVIKEDAPELLNREAEEEPHNLDKPEITQSFEPAYKKKKFTDKMKDLLK